MARKLQKKHFKSLAVIAAVTTLVIISSTMAYFSSKDNTTNKFVGSRFDVMLLETDWDPEKAQNVIPGEELDKNPQIVNSHYTDGAAQTDVYSLMFVLEVVPAGGSGTTEAVRRILHNGVTTGLTDQSAFPTPVIEGDYSSDWEFNGSWTYSYHDGGTVRTGTVNSAELLEVIRNAPDNAEITVTANLYSKS